MPWAQETGVAACVHVQQITGAGPLVAVGWLLDRGPTPGEPGPLEHLPDRRVREAGRAGDKTWTPARLASAIADPLLQLGGQQPRRPMRPARAIKQGGHLAAALEPAMPPTMRR